MKYFILLSILHLFLNFSSTPTKILIDQTIFYNYDKTYFKLEYSKITEKFINFFLFYEREEGMLDITIKYPTLNQTIKRIYAQKGNFNFSFIKNGSYEVMINHYDTNYGTNFKGKIKIVSTEFPFTLDLENNFNFEEVKLNSEIEPSPIIINFENNLNKDLMKTVSMTQYMDNTGTLRFLFLSENDNDYREVINDLIYFKKGVKYKMKLISKIFGNNYIRSSLTMKDYNINLLYVEDFSYGKKSYKNLDSVYIKVKTFENLSIKRYPLNYFGGYISICFNDEDLDNFPYSMQYLDFWNHKLEDFYYPFPVVILLNSVNNTDVYFTKTIEVQLNKEIFLTDTFYTFKLNYEKKSSRNETLLIFYEKQYQKYSEIIGIKKNYNNHDYEVNKTIGTITGTIDQSGIYYIFSNITKGNFKIVSSEYEFSIDANKEITIPRLIDNLQRQITFNITNLDRNYMKLISQTHDFTNAVLYSKNNNDFVELKNKIFFFEKGDSVKFRIILSNIVKKVRLSNIDENNIYDLMIKNYKFDNPVNQIFKINYFITPNFEIKGNEENKYYLSYITEDQYNNMPNCFMDLTFEEFGDDYYRKPEKYYYAILIAEIINNNTSLIINEIEKPIYNLYIEEENNFDYFKSNYQLKLSYKPNGKFLFIYKIYKNEEDIEIKIKVPNSLDETKYINLNEKKGNFFFGNYEEGVYNISINSDKYFEGIFKIIDTTYEFEIDINENIKLDSFTSNIKPSPIIMTFTIDDPNYVIYKKLFFIGEYKNYLDLIQIYDDDSKAYKNLSLNLYGFHGRKKYKIKIDYINYNNLNWNYIMEQFIMENFTEYNFEDFEFGLKKFNYTQNITFIKVDFRISPKIEVIIKKNNPNIKIAYYNDEEVDMIKILNDFIFYDLKNNLQDNCILDYSFNKSILMIELNQGETEIDFEIYKNKSKNKDDFNNDTGNKNNNTSLILAIVIPITIVASLIILFIFYKLKRKKDMDLLNDVNKQEIHSLVDK